MYNTTERAKEFRKRNETTGKNLAKITFPSLFSEEEKKIKGYAPLNPITERAKEIRKREDGKRKTQKLPPLTNPSQRTTAKARSSKSPSSKSSRSSKSPSSKKHRTTSKSPSAKKNKTSSKSPRHSQKKRKPISLNPIENRNVSDQPIFESKPLPPITSSRA